MQKNRPPNPGQIPELLQQAWKLHQSGQMAQAERIYRSILSAEPAHVDANNLMGLLCIQGKRPDLAERYIRRALRSDPPNAQSHYNLGIVFAEQSKFDEAAQHFGESAKLQPGNTEALSSHGNALRLAGKPASAVKVLESAIGLDSSNQGARQNLGLALNDQGAALVKAGDTKAAIPCFTRALEFTPGHPQALVNLGLTYEQRGDLDKADHHYQAAIQARPGFAEAYFLLSHLRTHRSSSEEIQRMKQLFSRAETSQPDRIRLAFGLGFALESCGRFSEAFHYMSAGHQLQGKDCDFSLDDETRRFSELQKLFSAERILSMAEAGLADERPVFVVGMPRSGTTLAEQILASHQQVHGAGEQTLLAETSRALAAKEAQMSADSAIVGSKTWKKAAQDYMDHIAAGAEGAIRITDTTPMNFLHVGVAAILLPKARFIFCLRDPMDNCLSIYRQYLTGANDYTHKLEHLAGYYLLHRTLVKHWISALPGRTHCLQYEQLISDHETETRRLLEFCDLPFDERCIAFHQSDRLVRSPSAAQVRQPIYQTSVNAWKRYEKELAPLQDVLSAAEQEG
jgi:Flp pilus assembly protein TadD